jgi:hypothetical protein
MRSHAVAGLALLVVLGAPQPAAAWGFEAHRYILSRAIELLPPEIRPFFEKYRDAIVEHSIDPDLWRTAGWQVEDARHYVDMDAYGPYPFSALPRDYDEAVKRRGEEFVTKNGVLPWRLEEMYGKLVEAFTQKAGYSRENIKFFSSVVGHYAADACVPFHAVLNHDGQLTGQSGIHARFESELFERYRHQLKVTPGRVVPVSSARDLAFDSLTASFQLVPQILDADRAAVAGREVYDDEYFKLLFEKVRPILEKRLADSITSVASRISSAWEKAGRPAVPLEAPRTPRKVRRQHH